MATAVDKKKLPKEFQQFVDAADADRDGKINVSEFKKLKAAKAKFDEEELLRVELLQYNEDTSFLESLRHVGVGVSKTVAKTLGVVSNVLTLGGLGSTIAAASDFAKRSLDHKREAFKANQNYETYDGLVSVCTEELERVLLYAQKRNAYAYRAHRIMHAIDMHTNDSNLSIETLKSMLLDPRLSNDDDYSSLADSTVYTDRLEPIFRAFAEKIAAVTITTKQDDERLFLALPMEPEEGQVQANKVYDPNENVYGFWKNTNNVISHLAVIAPEPSTLRWGNTTLQLKTNNPKPTTDMPVFNALTGVSKFNDIGTQLFGQKKITPPNPDPSKLKAKIQEFVSSSNKVTADEIEILGRLLAPEKKRAAKEIMSDIVKSKLKVPSWSRKARLCKRGRASSEADVLYCNLRAAYRRQKSNYDMVNEYKRQDFLLRPENGKQVFVSDVSDDGAPALIAMTYRAIAAADRFDADLSPQDAWLLGVNAINKVLSTRMAEGSEIEFKLIQDRTSTQPAAYVWWEWTRGSPSPTAGVVSEYYKLQAGLGDVTDFKQWQKDNVEKFPQTQQQKYSDDWGLDVQDDKLMSKSLEKIRTRSSTLPEYVQTFAMASAIVQAAFATDTNIDTMTPYDVKRRALAMVPVLYWPPDKTNKLYQQLSTSFEDADVYAICATRRKPKENELSSSSFATSQPSLSAPNLNTGMHVGAKAGKTTVHAQELFDTGKLKSVINVTVRTETGSKRAGAVAGYFARSPDDNLGFLLTYQGNRGWSYNRDQRLLDLLQAAKERIKPISVSVPLEAVTTSSTFEYPRELLALAKILESEVNKRGTFDFSYALRFYLNTVVPKPELWTKTKEKQGRKQRTIDSLMEMMSEILTNLCDAYKRCKRDIYKNNTALSKSLAKVTAPNLAIGIYLTLGNDVNGLPNSLYAYYDTLKKDQKKPFQRLYGKPTIYGHDQTVKEYNRVKNKYSDERWANLSTESKLKLFQTYMRTSTGETHYGLENGRLDVSDLPRLALNCAICDAIMPSLEVDNGTRTLTLEHNPFHFLNSSSATGFQTIVDSLFGPKITVPTSNDNGNSFFMLRASDTVVQYATLVGRMWNQIQAVQGLVVAQNFYFYYDKVDGTHKKSWWDIVIPSKSSRVRKEIGGFNSLRSASVMMRIINQSQTSAKTEDSFVKLAIDKAESELQAVLDMITLQVSVFSARELVAQGVDQTLWKQASELTSQDGSRLIRKPNTSDILDIGIGQVLQATGVQNSAGLAAAVPTRLDNVSLVRRSEI